MQPGTVTIKVAVDTTELDALCEQLMNRLRGCQSVSDNLTPLAVGACVIAGSSRKVSRRQLLGLSFLRR